MPSKKELPQGYYVYAHLRQGDLLPYYIGKGKGSRAWNTHGRRLPIPSDKNRIQILADNLTEEEALELEKKLIESYGREVNGTGILFNVTKGGEAGFSDNDYYYKYIRKKHLIGIEQAKLDGRYRGREPTARSQSQKVLDMKEKNFNVQEIMLECKISRASYYRILKDNATLA